MLLLNYKKLVILGLMVLFFSLAAGLNLFLSQPAAALSPSSPDAIATRVIPNPEHLSPLRWYQTNIKNQGSPQIMYVDGYEAIRDGRSVYVNAANIDLEANKFYTNIYLLSFSQNVERATEDIFGQLLSHWKFNTNIQEEVKKNRIRNDVKRLADLAEIRRSLNNYQKTHNGVYPVLSAGSYLSGKSISVWPSWRETLGKELGITTPLDPINELGLCDSDPAVNKQYNSITCWDQNNKKFAANLNDPDGPILPSQSHAYLYSVDKSGRNINLCTQMETSYSNITPFNCFADRLPNTAPVIRGANLVGWPKTKFIGYLRASDPDGDNVRYSIELVEPSPASKWASDYQWQWEAGFNKFNLKPSGVPGLVIVSADKAGKASSPGMYKIKFIVDDGQGQANSVVWQIFEVQVKALPMELAEKSVGEVEIGTNASFALAGTDSSGNPFVNLRVNNFTLDGTLISPDLLNSYGFQLNGMELVESYVTQQKTGRYKIDVTATDPTTGATKDSFFQIDIKNHPPVINSITANYANDTHQTYSAGTPFIIDNGENATIQILASDTGPGHFVRYELIDNNSGLAIDNTGLITNLNTLNLQSLTDATYNIKVRVFDQYCSQSKPEECSVTTNFNLIVKKYCSLTDLLSTQEVSLFPASTPYRINAPGGAIELGSSLADCSAVGRGKVDIKYNGTARSRAIIFVLDLSASMTANVTVGGITAPAINRLKDALVNPTSGVFKKLYDVGYQLPTGYYLKVGLVGFNSASNLTNYPNNYIYNPVNIAASGELGNLKNKVNNFATSYETNTLVALNKAEQLLGQITDLNTDKYVVLMSDGLPAVTSIVSSGTCCEDEPEETCPWWTCGGTPPNCITCCECGGTPPDNCNTCCAECGIYPICTNLPDNCNLCEKATCNGCVPRSCPCGGNRCSPESCVEQPPNPTNCECGVLNPNSCNPTCKPPPCNTSFYNNSWLKDIFDNIFSPQPARAITEQTKCLSGNTCGECPGQINTCCVKTTEYDCGDFSSDVDKQAQIIKGLPHTEFYSIYYNTSNTSEAEQRMCQWSNNNGLNCDNNSYFFSGNNISSMFDDVLANIVHKPKEVTIEGININDSQPYAIVNTDTNVDISSIISCGKINLPVSFSDSGFLEFFNLRFNYCPARYH